MLVKISNTKEHLGLCKQVRSERLCSFLSDVTKSNGNVCSEVLPVSLVQNKHLDLTKFKRRSVVQVIYQAAGRGNQDVRPQPQRRFLRLQVQAA